VRLGLWTLLVLVAAGCTENRSPAEQTGANLQDDAIMAVDSRPSPPPTPEQKRIEHLARMKGAIRLHAAADFASRCLLIDIPERAFIPIELNGDNLPELAVAFGRVDCSQMGATGFSSTGGSLVQFWSQYPKDRPATLLTQAHMLGFTPGNRRLVTQQHGSECGLPGAAGCQITYRWATNDFAGMTVERKPGGVGQRMAHEQLEGQLNLPEDGKRNRAEQLARLRAAIRQDARLNYGEYCGPIELPDNAFYQIEITGDDFPELAVSLGRTICPAQGATGFEGTGGAVIQVWHMARDHSGRDGPIRLLLETSMRGFTPGKSRLVTLQHGVACPGGAGPDLCRITYQWDEKTRHLDAAERRFRPKEGPADMRFGDEDL
jgi:hypothetical protein